MDHGNNNEQQKLSSNITKKVPYLYCGDISDNTQITVNFPTYLTNYILTVCPYGNGNPIADAASMYLITTGYNDTNTSTIQLLAGKTANLGFRWNNALSLNIQGKSGTWNICTIF